MAKKKKAMQSTDIKDQTGVDAEDLLDEASAEGEALFEEPAIFKKAEDDVARRMAMRRKLEQYLEERRLKKELGDDFEE